MTTMPMISNTIIAAMMMKPLISTNDKLLKNESCIVLSWAPFYVIGYDAYLFYASNVVTYSRTGRPLPKDNR